MSSSNPVAAPSSASTPSSSSSVDLALHTAIQRLKQPQSIPYSSDHLQQCIEEIRTLVLTPQEQKENECMNDEENAATPSSPTLHQFCSTSSSYAFFTSFLFRRDILATISSWQLPLLTRLILPWFSSPIPASSALIAISTAIRGGTIGEGAHGVVAAIVMRFVDEARIGEVVGECGTAEETKRNKTSAASSSASIVLSPSSQSLIDTLCSLPDLLSNTLQRSLPYALSHAAWYNATMTQVNVIMRPYVAASPPPTAHQLAPISALITKLVRLGQRQIVVDGLLAPIVEHIKSTPIEQLQSSSSSASSPSDLLAILAIVCQNVGVAAIESFLTAILEWLGSLNDGILTIRLLSALYPLTYYNSASFFSTMVTRRLFLSKSTLSLPAVQVLVAYVAYISEAKLSLLSISERNKTRVSHKTMLDSVLLDIVQIWSGGESGGPGTNGISSSSTTSAAAISTSMSADVQLYLSRSMLCILLQLERTTKDLNPQLSENKSSEESKKAETVEDVEKEESSLKVLGTFANSPAVPFLLSGIGSRLSSPILPVRAMAMQIAKLFSRLMGGAENELDFGEADDEAERKEEREEELERQKKQGSTVTLNPANMINPAHIAAASSSGVTPLVPHSLVDDERDLRKVALPSFLRDAIELIQKHSDSHDHIEAALEALPTLIRKYPADLPLLAGTLASSLVNLGTSVFMETSKKLANWRKQSLVALCSAAKGQDTRVIQTVTSYLVTQFYGSGNSLGAKVEILDILRMTAEKMSDMDDAGVGEGSESSESKSSSSKPLIQEVSSSSSLTPINTPRYSASSSASAVSSTLAHHQAIIQERVEKRTKRWGSTKTSITSANKGALTKTKTYSVNRFTPVAHLFFYPLMKLIDAPTSIVMLHQHDSLLLIRLLHTLAAFLPCSSGLAQSLPLIARSMARVLLEYLLMHGTRIAYSRTQSRNSQEEQQAVAQIGIRRMIFFALSRILVTYNEKLFADDFPRELPELISWLTDAVARDVDAECRQLAQANLYFLKQLLGDPFERVFKEEANQQQAQQQSSTGLQLTLPAFKF